VVSPISHGVVAVTLARELADVEFATRTHDSEAHLAPRVSHTVVVVPEPADEAHDFGVAPHPGRKPVEVVQRFDDGESVLLDQPLGDPGSLAGEVRGPVGRFTDHHDAAIGDEIEQLVVVASLDRPGDAPETGERCPAGGAVQIGEGGHWWLPAAVRQ